MDKEQIYQLTAERIAENDEHAVRELVRRNARLSDEVIWLNDEVDHLRAVLNGFLEVHDRPPGRKVQNPIKPVFQIKLLKFKDGIRPNGGVGWGYIGRAAFPTTAALGQRRP